MTWKRKDSLDCIEAVDSQAEVMGLKRRVMGERK